MIVPYRCRKMLLLKLLYSKSSILKFSKSFMTSLVKQAMKNKYLLMVVCLRDLEETLFNGFKISSFVSKVNMGKMRFLSLINALTGV